MISSIINAQEKRLTIFDTVSIDEVQVTSIIPLNDNSSLNYYQQNNATNIDEINKRLGGVSLISRGAYAHEPMLNGFSAGQINITIDGMKIFGACTDKMDPVTSYVEPVNLSEIAVDQGSNGNEFGNTVGGAFNMGLQNAQVNKIGLAAGVIYESVHKGKTATIDVNIGKKKWAYRLSGVLRNYQSYTDGSGTVVPFTYFKKNNIYQTFVYVPDEGREISLDILIDNAHDIGYPALPMDVSKAKGRLYSLEYSNKNAYLNFSNVLAKAYYNTVYHLMDDSQRDSLYFVYNSQTGNYDSVFMKMDMPGSSNTGGAFIQGTQVLGAAHRLFTKLESYYNWSKAEMTMYMNNLSNPGEPPMYAETWPEHYRIVTGLFLKYDYSFNPKWSLNMNFRLDHNQSQILSEQGKNQFLIFDYNTEEELTTWTKSINGTISCSPGNSINFRLGTGFGERVPDLSEQFGFYLYNAYDGYDYLGNPMLKTEKSINSWINIQYSRPKFKLNFESHANRVKDYIYGKTNTSFHALNLYASGVKQYENLEWANIFAVNMQAMLKPYEYLTLLSTTKYNYGKLSINEAKPLVPPLTSFFNVIVQIKDYTIRSESEFSAAQHRVNVNYGETKSSAYALFHIYIDANFTFKTFDFTIHTGIENLFNEMYSEHLDWRNYYRPGRNFNFGFTFQF